MKQKKEMSETLCLRGACRHIEALFFSLLFESKVSTHAAAHDDTLALSPTVSVLGGDGGTEFACCCVCT